MGKHYKDMAVDGQRSWLVWCTLAKYVLVLCVSVVSAQASGDPRQFVSFVAELFVIATLSEVLVRRNRVAGTIVNGLLMLLFLVQVLVLYFGGTFISSIMVTNLEFLGDIQGNATEYITAAVVAVIVSFLPICPLPWAQRIPNRAVAALSVAGVALSCLSGASYSPSYAYVDLGIRMWQIQDRSTRLQSTEGDPSLFYHKHIAQGIDRPDNLPEHPNIVLIMVEGLSQNIVEDERGIMPNVWEYEQKSISFANYYNHTAATLRGIIGQLYSGYQNENLGRNNLVSMQALLSDEGYQTAFLNTEPRNRVFTKYLRRLGFDELVDGRDYTEGVASGPDKTLTDKDAYKALFAKMQEMDAGDDPFFITMYTFGTHVSFDSPDETFGDGSNPELNKFYSADHWFGEFMDDFNASELVDDTIVIFTTDHATYRDKRYKETFPDYRRFRPFLDRIPLFFYYEGVDAHWVEAYAQNSLDLAPTVLDLIDVDGPNYFLGQSLFLDADESVFDNYYVDTQDRTTTKDGVILFVEGDELEWFESELMAYYAAATSGE